MTRSALATAFVCLLAAAAFAGPKDQGKNSMIGPQDIGGNATVNNATTAISIKNKGCTVQGGFKGLNGVADGDVIICIADADVIAPPAVPAPGSGNSVVIVGEVKKNAMKFKADLSEVLCGSTAAINFNTTVRCYLDDPAYRTPGGTWQAACTSTPGSIAVPNNSPDPRQLKVNAGQNVVVGLCQNVTGTLGARIDPPASALIAVQGGLVPAL